MTARSLVLSLLLAGPAGCAWTNKNYNDTAGLGTVHETHLGERIHEVSFTPTKFMDPDRVRRAALHRAAELTRERGFTHLVILSEHDDRSARDLLVFPTHTVRFEMLRAEESASRDAVLEVGALAAGTEPPPR